MSADKKELKKEWAKYKREATEIASVIHDIVEDTLYVDYEKLPQLSQDLVVAVQKANDFKNEHSL